MSILEDALDLAILQYKKEYGEDAKIEEGEEFATVFNDAVLIIGLENKQISIKVLVGKPYFVNRNLNLTEIDMNINGKDYITGVFRGDNGENMVTHLYDGNFENPGFPMCSRGWQRKWYDSNGKVEDYEYSIFRNLISNAGICKTCLRRARANLPPIKKPVNKKYRKL